MGVHFMTQRLPTERHIEKIDDRDKFNYKLLSSQLLHTILLEMTAPNCLGIYGNWGSGKSTLLHFMIDHIQKNEEKKFSHITTVYFEPWKYEYAKDGDLLFALLRKIEKTLKPPKAKWKTHVSDLLTLGSWASRNFLNADPEQIEKDMKRWDEALHKEHELWIDNVESFRGDFETAIAEALKGKEKELLVVFVDDLDRCLPENAVRLLEAIKNFLHVEKVIFVVAVDRRVISSMIEKKYGLKDGYGDDYLMKIIHYSYDIPVSNTREIVNQVLNNYDLVQEDGERKYIADFLARFAPEPRRVKHFVYQFCMRYLFGGQQLHNFAVAAQKRAGMEHTCKRMDVFVVAFLMSRFPKVFALENAESRLRSVYENTNPTNQKNADVNSMLSSNEQRMIKEIFQYGYSSRYNDRQSMAVEQVIEAYQALRTMSSTNNPSR